MFVEKKIYNGKKTEILYPEEGYLLQHKKTHLIYGAVSLEEGRRKSDYTEIEISKEEKNESIVD